MYLLGSYPCVYLDLNHVYSIIFYATVHAVQIFLLLLMSVLGNGTSSLIVLLDLIHVFTWILFMYSCVYLLCYCSCCTNHCLLLLISVLGNMTSSLVLFGSYSCVYLDRISYVNLDLIHVYIFYATVRAVQKTQFMFISVLECQAMLSSDLTE